MLKVGLHIHTKYSHDSLSEPEDLLELAKKQNFDVLGICDHNTTKGAIETRKIAHREYKDILVLLGQEIKTECGDMIVFGTDKNLPTRIFELLDEANSKGLFVMMPHPFDRLRKTSAVGLNMPPKEFERVLRRIDAVEVFNARCLFNRFNKQAEGLCENYGLSGIASSDAHVVGDIGNTYNVLDCKKSESEVLETLRSGKFLWYGRRMSNMKFMKRGLAKLSRRFLG